MYVRHVYTVKLSCDKILACIIINYWNQKKFALYKLTHFSPIFSIYTPENRKPKSFLIFSGNREIEHCLILLNNHVI